MASHTLSGLEAGYGLLLTRSQRRPWLTIGWLLSAWGQSAARATTRPRIYAPER